MNLLDKKGNLRFSVSILMGCLGGALVLLPLYLELNPYLVISGFLIGMALMGFASLSLKSATLDLRAFTHDPLGWRQAKQSYKIEGEEKKQETDKP